LDCGTVGNSFIRIDLSVEALAVKELREHGLNFWYSGRSTDENDVVNLTLAHIGVLQHLLDRWHALAEERHAKFFELGSGHAAAEVFSLSQ